MSILNFYKKNKEKETTLVQLVFPKTNKELEEKLEEITPKFTDRLAQVLSGLSFDNLPSGAHISSYLVEMQTGFQGVLSHLYQCMQSEIGEQGSINDGLDAQEKVQKLDRQINEKAAVLARLKSNIRESAHKLGAKIRKWTHQIRFAAIGITVGDAAVNFRSMQQLGGNLISSLVLSVMLGLSLYFYGHLTVRVMRKYGANSSRKNLMIAIIMSIPAVVSFGTLSYLRTQYMGSLNDSGLTTSPLIFTFLNLFIFSIVVYLTDRYMPTKTDQESYEVYLQDKKEIDQLEDDIEVLTAEKENLPAELRARLLLRDNVRDYVLRKARDIDNSYRACFAQFKTSLLLRNPKANSLFTHDIEQDLPKLDLEDFVGKQSNDLEGKRKSKLMTTTLIGVGLFLASCSPQPNVHQRIDKVLLDITGDSLLAQQELLRNDGEQDLLAQPSTINNGQSFGLSYITEFRYGETKKQVSLEPLENEWLSNEILRKNEINQYEKSVKTLLSSSLQSGENIRPHSLVFYHVHKSLCELAQSPYHQKNLYVFSDWMEHSGTINMYTNLRVYENDPQKLYVLLRKEEEGVGATSSSFQDKNITLYIIHKSRNEEEDVRFFRLMNLIKPYFEQKNVSVIIGSSIEAVQQSNSTITEL